MMIELSKMVGTLLPFMLDMAHNISVTMLLMICIGPAMTFLELATLADSRGIVVGTGTGSSSCFMLRSSMSSCISKDNSILIDVRPPLNLDILCQIIDNKKFNKITSFGIVQAAVAEKRSEQQFVRSEPFLASIESRYFGLEHFLVLDDLLVQHERHVLA